MNKNNKVLLRVENYGISNHKDNRVIVVDREVADIYLNNFKQVKSLYRKVQIEEIDFADSYSECVDICKDLIPYDLSIINEKIDEVRKNITQKALDAGKIRVSENDSLFQGLEKFTIMYEPRWRDPKIIYIQNYDTYTEITSINAYDVDNRIKTLGRHMEDCASFFDVVLKIEDNEIEGVDPWELTYYLQEKSKCKVKPYDGEEIILYKKTY